MFLNQLPDLKGYLILNTDGAVCASHGELKNAEHVANVIMSILTLTDKLNGEEEGYKKLAIVYPDHSYEVCLSNKKIYIVMKKVDLMPTDVLEEPHQVAESSNQ